MGLVGGKIQLLDEVQMTQHWILAQGNFVAFNPNPNNLPKKKLVKLMNKPFFLTVVNARNVFVS